MDCQFYAALEIVPVRINLEMRRTCDNRFIIGLIKRVHVRDALFDAENLRIRSEELHIIGRMASPNWYCRTTDRFEMVRPK